MRKYCCNCSNAEFIIPGVYHCKALDIKVDSIMGDCCIGYTEKDDKLGIRLFAYVSSFLLLMIGDFFGVIIAWKLYHEDNSVYSCYATACLILTSIALSIFLLIKLISYTKYYYRKKGKNINHYTFDK